MEDKKILLDNIDKIHTTEMGVDRIKRTQWTNLLHSFQTMTFPAL